MYVELSQQSHKDSVYLRGTFRYQLRLGVSEIVELRIRAFANIIIEHNSLYRTHPSNFVNFLIPSHYSYKVYRNNGDLPPMSSSSWSEYFARISSSLSLAFFVLPHLYDNSNRNATMKPVAPNANDSPKPV